MVPKEKENAKNTEKVEKIEGADVVAQNEGKAKIEN